jgi:hypothetical protein
MKMKKVFIFLAALALATTLIVGCSQYQAPSEVPDQTTSSPASSPNIITEPQSPGPSTGTIKVLVTDAPAHNVSSVNLTVSEVQVHKAGGDGELGWQTLPIQEESFNLLDLQNGLTLLLAGGAVESGNYTQLRMTVFKVLIDYDDVQGKEATVPSGELKFVHPFTLEAGGEITLKVDIDAAKSVVFTEVAKDGAAKVLFKPVVKLSIEKEKQPSPQSQPDISVDPLAIDFNSVVVGESSSAETITISNTGTADLNISDMILSDTTNFSLDVNGGSNPAGSAALVIPAGEHRTVTITFNPTSTGNKPATLSIGSDDPEEATVDVDLNGTGE